MKQWQRKANHCLVMYLVTALLLPVPAQLMMRQRWHRLPTVSCRYESLESLQKWAMLIIFPHLDYSGSLVIAEADTLEGRREQLAQHFSRRNVLNETSYLHYLLKSQERSQDIVSRLRSSQTYEHYSVRTEKFKRSFIPFSVNNYQ